tara:strand:+ start:41 stop:220 length:180 start_codon:yes stop_codon:yes gene_type:complete
MSIFNPWTEASKLRKQVIDLDAALGKQILINKLLLRKIADMHPRDPKTGRILPKGSRND